MNGQYKIQLILAFKTQLKASQMKNTSCMHHKGTSIYDHWRSNFHKSRGKSLEQRKTFWATNWALDFIYMKNSTLLKLIQANYVFNCSFKKQTDLIQKLSANVNKTGCLIWCFLMQKLNLNMTFQRLAHKNLEDETCS